jgi:DNA modification methylase
MSLWYDSSDCAVFHGSALEDLHGMRDGIFQCCVTSPPYWGLRDYKAEGQLGLEKSPEEYVEKLVEILREVRRVLREDGTLWLNLGDSYSRAPEKGGSDLNGKNGYGEGYTEARHILSESKGSSDGKVGRGDRAAVRNGCTGLKPKDLVGIPWLVAFALRADGWWLRQEIIWSKPNTMPESVKDRCTKSHEHIFLLAKSERYYFDAEAIKEPAIGADRIRSGQFGGNKHNGSTTKHSDGSIFNQATMRNKRDVWTIATSPFPEAHFATFPPKLIEPCILAGCPYGGLVLDPFAGSGTTLATAISLDRRAIGIELQQDYLPMIQRRIEKARKDQASSATDSASSTSSLSSSPDTISSST